MTHVCYVNASDEGVTLRRNVPLSQLNPNKQFGFCQPRQPDTSIVYSQRDPSNQESSSPLVQYEETYFQASKTPESLTNGTCNPSRATSNTSDALAVQNTSMKILSTFDPGHGFGSALSQKLTDFQKAKDELSKVFAGDVEPCLTESMDITEADQYLKYLIIYDRYLGLDSEKQKKLRDHMLKTKGFEGSNVDNVIEFLQSKCIKAGPILHTFFTQTIKKHQQVIGIAKSYLASGKQAYDLSCSLANQLQTFDQIITNDSFSRRIAGSNVVHLDPNKIDPIQALQLTMNQLLESQKNNTRLTNTNTNVTNAYVTLQNAYNELLAENNALRKENAVGAETIRILSAQLEQIIKPTAGK
jgi:hypothetical protein